MTNKCLRRISGKVKWFNSKLGYGFITHKNDTNKDVDVFVHWSNLLLSDKDFHTLYKGEYVEFELEKCTCNSSGLGIQACRVSGPNNGQLLTTANSDTLTHIYNAKRFSRAFCVRQLDPLEFTGQDNLSQKASELYRSYKRCAQMET